jgi:hypothetical protein
MGAVAYPAGLGLPPKAGDCTLTSSTDGDLIDNDCDAQVDEELGNGVDDDGDGLIDEDLAAGELSTNTAPSAASFGLDTTEGAPAGLVLHGRDPNLDDLQFNITGLPSFGRLKVFTSTGGAMALGGLSNVSRSLVYEPDPGFVGSDVFYYTSSDGSLVSRTATVTIDVLDSPDDFDRLRGSPVFVTVPTATAAESAEYVYDYEAVILTASAAGAARFVPGD